MGCFLSKKQPVKAVYDSVWDLLDSDGDAKVASQELDSVSNIIHSYQVECCENSLNQLKQRNPTEYVMTIIGKNQKDLLVRNDFKKIAPLLPHTKWHNEIIPVLRTLEIRRLRKEQANHETV